MNYFDAKLVKTADTYAVELDGKTIELSKEKQDRLAAGGVEPQDITLGVRPEHIALLGEGQDMFTGTVDVSEMMGSSVHLHLKSLGQDVIVIAQTMNLQGPQPSHFQTGQNISFTFGGNVVHLFSKDGKNLEF